MLTKLLVTTKQVSFKCRAVFNILLGRSKILLGMGSYARQFLFGMGCKDVVELG